MANATITLTVDQDVAEAYASASAEAQQKYQLLLNLWLRQLTSSPSRPLPEIMDELSAKAEARGLTEEELESILNDE
jgi:hypothetical protein